MYDVYVTLTIHSTHGAPGREIGDILEISSDCIICQRQWKPAVYSLFLTFSEPHVER